MKTVDPELLAEIFGLYTQNLPQEAHCLAAAWKAAHDECLPTRKKLTETLHRLAGSAATFGHTAVAEPAAAAERLLQAGASLHEARELVEKTLAAIASAAPS